MPDLATRTLETLGLLYGTALGVDGWARVLDSIAGLVGGNGALLFVNEAGLPELRISARSTRYKAEDVEQYRTSLVAGDEMRWVQVLDELPPRTIQRDVDIWPDRGVYDAMPSVRFLRALHLYHRVAVRPCAHGGWKDVLTVLFAEGRGGIRPAEARRLSLLLPHLAHAIEMQRPFQLLMRRFGSVLAVLDLLGIGVVIAREHGDVIVSNREAQRIFAARDGLGVAPRGRIAAVDEEADARLRSALQAAERAARLETPGFSATVEVPRRTAGDPYLVDVVPLRDAADDLGSDFRGVLLIVVDPDHREMISIQGLAQSYGLTPAETRVCAMIAQGLTLQEIADSRGVSFDTVKSQSRAIYAKTNTGNRRGLVRRALSIVPPLLDRHGKRIT